MGTCERYERAVLDGASVDGGLQGHLAECPHCAEAAERQTRYERTMEAARRSLEADVTLSPGAWVRVRDAVDDRARRRHRRAVWVPLVAAAAAAALVLVVDLPGERREETPGPEAAAPATTAPFVTEPAQPEQDPSAGEAAPTVAVGDVLEAGADGRRIAAFDQHLLTLEPHARVRVDAWRPEAVVLHVLDGELTCDVARERPDDLFEVRSDAARVRVLGTTFTVAVDDAGSTKVRVTHGRVSVTGPSGDVRALDAGQTTRITPQPAVAESAGDEPADEPSASESTSAESAGDRSTSARASGESASAPGDDRSRDRGVEVIEIDVPPQAMEPPDERTSASEPTTPERRDRPAPEPEREEHPGDDEDLKVIEIDVPPQRAPDTP
ncbi:MAG: FecR domain-containing protein [Myxococcota bacterium]